MPASLDGPAALLFDRLGPDMPFLTKMAIANQWLLGRLIIRQLSIFEATNALVRTTTAATMIEGGIKENVLPARARAVVNFRIKPGDTIDKVLSHVKTAIADPRVTVKLLDPTSARTRHPSQARPQTPIARSSKRSARSSQPLRSPRRSSWADRLSRIRTHRRRRLSIPAIHNRPRRHKTNPRHRRANLDRVVSKLRALLHPVADKRSVRVMLPPSESPCEKQVIIITLDLERVRELIPTSCTSCPPCGSEFRRRGGEKNQSKRFPEGGQEVKEGKSRSEAEQFACPSHRAAVGLDFCVVCQNL